MIRILLADPKLHKSFMGFTHRGQPVKDPWTLINRMSAVRA